MLGVEGAVTCFFVSDLHGRAARYERLCAAIMRERPEVVLLGGDILPHAFHSANLPNFIRDYLCVKLRQLRKHMGNDYPKILLILGNDDPRAEEGNVLAESSADLLNYIHGKRLPVAAFDFYGYACVPPTPFQLKDWERYDVSRYVPPGSISPEEGFRSVEVPEHEIKWGTIDKDLESLACDACLAHAIFLFHTPPYDTPLDLAQLDGQSYDHVPLDPHVGSIAVRRFIERRQPLMSLHGHIHESARLSGEWKTRIGRTVCVTAAHDGPELAMVRFDPERPADATRELL